MLAWVGMALMLQVPNPCGPITVCTHHLDPITNLKDVPKQVRKRKSNIKDTIRYFVQRTWHITFLNILLMFVLRKFASLQGYII